VAALSWDELDKKAVDTARVLAADAVEKVGNGHPGTAMSLAPAAYLLYQKVMRHDPSDTHWVGRDRFILSAGHSSLTQYVQLYLGGFGLELDDLKSLRTWGSKTPGHPEFGHTDGVEITTGPLGQGISSAVGFAYAQRFERGLFDPDAADGESPFDHYTYVIAGDGDLQEGVSAEASSLAGHQQLGNLIAIYDSNQISIEDDTNIAFTEDAAKRYEAYGWHVQTVDWKKTGEYVEDVQALYDAILAAQGERDKPSLIILKTIIGWPSPKKQNTGKIHGSALGAEELAGLKEVLGFDPAESFVVADEVIAHTRQLVERGKAARAEWQKGFDAWAAANPEKKSLFDRIEAGVSSLDLFLIGQLTFQRPDMERFPCLRLAYDALRAGGAAPAVLNAANEEAVAAFLDGRIGFRAICEVIACALERGHGLSVESLEAVLESDRRARELARAAIARQEGR